jgi:hypothetical protein
MSAGGLMPWPVINPALVVLLGTLGCKPRVLACVNGAATIVAGGCSTDSRLLASRIIFSHSEPVPLSQLSLPGRRLPPALPLPDLIRRVFWVFACPMI